MMLFLAPPFLRGYPIDRQLISWPDYRIHFGVITSGALPGDRQS